MFNSLTYLVPVNVLLKVYHKVLFLPPYSFPFTINSLAFSPNDDAVVVLFADDVSILTTACKKEDAEAAAQSVVNCVVIWSQEWKLNLNADKSEVCPFSTWSNNSTWNRNGVILDRSLTFNAHLKKTSSQSSGICIIRAIAHTSWGWCCSTLKMGFHALMAANLTM